MKKLVLKTTAITLAAIVCTIMVAFGVAALCAPKFVAGLFDDVGGYSASIFFYEKQYDKTKSLDDLALLIDKIDKEEDAALAKDYLKILIESDEFSSFCSARDSEKQSGVNTKEYYTSVYAVTLYRTSDLDGAIDVSKSYVKENGYTEYNPFRALVSEVDGDVAAAIKVSAAITASSVYVDKMEGVFVIKDLAFLAGIEPQ